MPDIRVGDWVMIADRTDSDGMRVPEGNIGLVYQIVNNIGLSYARINWQTPFDRSYPDRHNGILYPNTWNTQLSALKVVVREGGEFTLKDRINWKIKQMYERKLSHA